MVEVDGSGWELYDLESDPFEVNDLINKYPGIATKLSADWLNWWKTENNVKEYIPESTQHDRNYKPQGDRGAGALYKPSAMPLELSKKYPVTN